MNGVNISVREEYYIFRNILKRALETDFYSLHSLIKERDVRILFNSFVDGIVFLVKVEKLDIGLLVNSGYLYDVLVGKTQEVLINNIRTEHEYVKSMKLQERFLTEFINLLEVIIEPIAKRLSKHHLEGIFYSTAGHIEVPNLILYKKGKMNGTIRRAF